MRIWCLLISLILMCFSLLAKGNRVEQTFIFFGDSQTDSGNHPEPSNINNPKLRNFNLYVPLANPVKVLDKNFKSFLNASLGYPNAQGKINHQARALHSINWPLYFLYRESNRPLVTWYSLQRNKNITQNKPVNINYAWASAVAGGLSKTIEPTGRCFHTRGQPFGGNCTEKTVMKNRQLYLKKTYADPQYDSNQGYSYKELQIPDLNKQLSFYLNDKTIALRNNTNFFIYIGANDIGHFLRQNTRRIVLSTKRTFMRRVRQTMPLITQHVDMAISRIENAYRSQANDKKYHIYVLTLFHLSNLYSGYANIHPRILGGRFWLPIISSRIQSAINGAVDVYNAELKVLAKKYANVTLINTGPFLDKLALSNIYRTSINRGKMCANDVGYRVAKPKNIHNCHYGNNKIYFNWNNSHITSPVNQTLANYIYDQFDNIKTKI